MYQLDTSILSEYAKKRSSAQILAWLEAQNERNLFVSRLTIAELHKGRWKLESRAQSETEFRRARGIGDWIQKVEERFEGRILPIDKDVLATWAKLCGTSLAKGIILPVVDSLLASSALNSKLSLVTTNERDFRRCSQTLTILNPMVATP